ncbi:MAG: methionyl-tRNA formyltransferase [Geobacteraceae bacterium]|nr:methionyl-tRNA formyltransferase [Geobacteraceae bacterium]
MILFGVTGFGNAALRALVGTESIEFAALICNKRPSKPFPYYVCDCIHDEARALGVPFFEGLILKDRKSVEIIRELKPDLIVVSSYFQMITQEILDLPRLGTINFHPSLLPAYRGATPTVWTILNGEKRTGMTAHFIENEEYDQGRIITQKEIEICPEETDGSLRMRLSMMLDELVPEAINLVMSNRREDFAMQDEHLATFQEKRTTDDGLIDLSRSVEEIRNRLRAMTPYPGAFIETSRELVKVSGLNLLPPTDVPDDDSKFIYVKNALYLMQFERA